MVFNEPENLHTQDSQFKLHPIELVLSILQKVHRSQQARLTKIGSRGEQFTLTPQHVCTSICFRKRRKGFYDVKIYKCYNLHKCFSYRSPVRSTVVAPSNCSCNKRKTRYEHVTELMLQKYDTGGADIAGSH